VQRLSQCIFVTFRVGTGTLISMYLMKHYGFTSAEVIGYLRIMRPGSVLGPQQFFLKQWERPMWAQGEAYRRGAPIQPYSGDSGYGKSSSSSPKAASAAAFSDSPLARPMGSSSPVQQTAKKSPALPSSAAAAPTSSPSLAANGSAPPRQLLPGISASKPAGSLTSSFGSMMLSASAAAPSSYSPSSRPSASPPSPLMRSSSLQSFGSRFAAARPSHPAVISCS
jgi:cell division cycle 14